MWLASKLHWLHFPRVVCLWCGDWNFRSRSALGVQYESSLTTDTDSHNSKEVFFFCLYLADRLLDVFRQGGARYHLQDLG